MSPDAFNQWLLDPDRRPLVMGVLNVTPDSFSDGNRFSTVAAAQARAEAMIAEGVDLIDIGGESTRPGATRVSAQEQISRIVPVLRACRTLPTVFSVDTTRAEVARAALESGAMLVNDVSAGSEDADMMGLVARNGCPVILMHMQGEPATMQANPHYENVVTEVRDHLIQRAKAFEAAGVARERILLDPGIGFGKTIDHNLTLLRELSTLTTLPYAMLVGVSRKGFIGRLTGRTDPADRVFGTAAAVAWSVSQGAAIVRVHDVAAMADVVAVAGAIVGRKTRPLTP
ncbi:MAG TPA: dihydropteroate synthase [Tepidisphaeraceae bacterium]|jgi:dihydropteroate synthase